VVTKTKYDILNVANYSKLKKDFSANFEHTRLGWTYKRLKLLSSSIAMDGYNNNNNNNKYIYY
jgi:hypothetical protein